MQVDDRLLTAARAGDEAAFAALSGPLRREIRVHCYRMTGSFTESEDLTQETMLRAWRRIDSVRAQSAFRAWLYRIATNVTLDWLRGQPRRLLPYDVVGAADVDGPPPVPVEYLAVEPFPDALLPGGSAGGPETDDVPEDVVVARETIEVAFLAAVQHLTPAQRAVLILRDVEGWPARDVGDALGMTPAVVKSSLQRARAALRRRLGDREAWRTRAEVSEDERAVLRQYVAAHRSDDPADLAALLVDDVRVAYAPHSLWVASRESFVTGSRDHASPGEYRFVMLSANRQPAVAIYNRPPGGGAFVPVALELLRVDGGRVVEVLDFSDPPLLAALGLPDAPVDDAAGSSGRQ